LPHTAPGGVRRCRSAQIVTRTAWLVTRGEPKGHDAAFSGSAQRCGHAGGGAGACSWLPGGKQVRWGQWRPNKGPCAPGNTPHCSTAARLSAGPCRLPAGALLSPRVSNCPGGVCNRRSRTSACAAGICRLRPDPSPPACALPVCRSVLHHSHPQAGRQQAGGRRGQPGHRRPVWHDHSLPQQAGQQQAGARRAKGCGHGARCCGGVPQSCGGQHAHAAAAAATLARAASRVCVDAH
jgi:hypothetical protein